MGQCPCGKRNPEASNPLLPHSEKGAAKVTNSAFVFIKPHAVTDKTKKLAKEGLESRGIKILKEGSLSGKVIDEKKLIDQHYYAIASKATILKPKDLNVPADKFQAQFGTTWQEALDSGKVFNAMDGCTELGIDADALDAEWAKAKAAKKLVKFGGGFYCGLIEIAGKDPLYIFNGFFMSMRAKFTKPGTEIYYYVVEWDPKALPWGDFRGKVLGPTDPAEAPADSLRGQILAKWKELGLSNAPNVGDNGMHASASPFEAFAERCNWLSVNMKDDPFGEQMLAAGLPESLIKDWSVDPQVKIEEGKKGSIFDALEDLDSKECLEKIMQLSKLNLN
uniref:Nucleoside-diphosphate kinase n=1 Tax=Pyrodinium bahamense TaxID=73915 RepID=A0A7S0ANU9_9DINO|mmetsp:Transcript_38440/g.107072  ORF Transcript_38440/g.107072 Transcript_38440/m.107072 type:complete len:335 (+) Transcript_38440:70-1074(+)|eukprot:CAMPEP_0179057516 /NCGR_PEP_ID=MMETSP0796-20121207/24374_1 /TAXON_ID=73915 /ORGANISM="Pyrodinium bahamense, Strain pbaha01" /LENGTH=334 /DNA_ID=CAMNT_0020754237 /DNA_START=70 /DNA_END=1074 /DNA_ORIENTATION=+